MTAHTIPVPDRLQRPELLLRLRRVNRSDVGEHRIPVPDRLQRPLCRCGWAAPYPFKVSWDEWDRLALAHLTATSTGHRHTLDDAADRCPTCQQEARR